MKVNLIWITPNAAKVISYCARVSNPANQDKEPGKLLSYLIEHKHWSPFEMASACFEIETTRDIARQMLRHRSFSFQEFSQRYAEVPAFVEPRQARLQDHKNRQNSLPCDSLTTAMTWVTDQWRVMKLAREVYNDAIKAGVAKEVARTVLPEGLTPSRLYMSGTVRSWIHYCEVRNHADTQLEHRLIAEEIENLLWKHLNRRG